MKLRITSVAEPASGRIISAFTNYLEDNLKDFFLTNDYGGVQQVTIVFIAVDTDDIENLVFCRQHNGYGKYKDFETGKMVNYIEFAIPISPKIVEHKSFGLNALIEYMLVHLQSPIFPIKKTFNFDFFLNDLTINIKKYL